MTCNSWGCEWPLGLCSYVNPLVFITVPILLKACLISAGRERWEKSFVADSEGRTGFVFDCVELVAIRRLWHKTCRFVVAIGGSGAPSSEEPVLCPINKPLLSAETAAAAGMEQHSTLIKGPIRRRIFAFWQNYSCEMLLLWCSFLVRVYLNSDVLCLILVTFNL